jgi:hypothetical protein
MGKNCDSFACRARVVEFDCVHLCNLKSSIGKRGSGPGGAGGALSTTHDVVTGYHIIPITRACNVFKECGCVDQ